MNSDSEDSNKDTIFKALKNAKAINSRDYKLLSEGWNDIAESSKNILDKLEEQQNIQSVEEMPLYVLNLFKPNEVENHIKNIKKITDNYSLIFKVYQKALGRKKGEELIRNFNKMNPNNYLENCLIAPVQRVPRYNLFLDKLQGLMNIPDEQRAEVEKQFRETNDYLRNSFK